MRKALEEMDASELLLELAKSQRRSARSARVTAIVLVLLAAALITGLALLVPAATRTLAEAETALQQVQGSLQGLSGLAAQLSALGSGADSQNLAYALQAINSIDFQGLSTSINQLNNILGSLAAYFG